MHTQFLTILLALVASARIPVLLADCVWDEDRLHSQVECTWLTIDNSSSRTDLHEAATASRLLLTCEDAGQMYADSLPGDLFQQLDTVEELQIDACKFLQMPANSLNGLRDRLHTLRINTRISKWGPTQRLQLDAELFAGCAQLQHLDLADNNLRSMSAGLFCPLRSIQHLNVSHNHLRSAAELGFAHCTAADAFAQLRTLDMSHNELVSMDAAWSQKELRSVQTLLLQHNNLTRLERGLFDGMPALRVLNVSGNHLETMPSALFARNTQLQELHAQSNRFYQLPVDVFANLGELLVLDLSDNQLSSHYVDTAIFAHLRRLVVLELGNNALTRIDAATFAQLSFLQILDLKNNSIGFIDAGTFEPLVNLHTLNLAGNRLHIVNNDLFNGLFVLSRLVLSNNLITVVESAAFRNCSSLRELDLSSNQLSDVPAAIAALNMLRSLDLGENRIAAIGNDSFRNLQQLTGLRLMDNLITNVTVGALFNMPKLNVLNLAHNKIQSIDIGSFDQNMEIEAIRLDRNLLSDVNGIFATLNSLQWLNLSENQLSWFDYAFIPKDLKWLDIHFNYIESLGNYYKLKEQISLTTLDASHNRITELSVESVPNSIELFFVNNNLIRNIYPNTFVDKINLTRVDMYSNSLTKISLHAIRIAPMLAHGALPDFYLGGNPLECDCTMSWLRHRAGSDNTAATVGGHQHLVQHQQPRIADFDIVECLVAHKRTNPVRLLATLTHQDFLCRFESQCPASCHCCEFKTCHCQVKCPDLCSCFNDQSGSIVRVNCGKQNALTMPERIPMDSTQLFLDGNNYLEMKSYSFASLKKLKSLYLNSSNIIQLQSHALTGLSNVHRLHLNDNKLTVLYGFEFLQAYNLRELYLQDNMLTYIENSTFAGLRHLQVLRLDGNRLTSLTSWQMQSSNLRGLRQLTLADNMWSCGCEFMQQFIPFVYDNDVEVVDAGALVCHETGSNANAVAKREQKIEPNMPIESCARTVIGNNVLAASALPEGIPHGYVPLLGFAITIVFVLAVLVAVFTVKERLCCAYRSQTDVEKSQSRPLYDVLLLTALEDSDYVSANIVAALHQTKPTISVGLQHRNVSSGQVVAAANRSSKIVIYLSNAFLATEWKRPEVRSAISNSWIPGKIILVQTPNVQFQSNTDRELINNIGRGIVLLRTWEIDFALKLAYSLDTHPSHYVDSTMVGTMQSAVGGPVFMETAAGSSCYSDPSEKIWKSTSSRLVHPYTYVVDYAEAGDMRNDSYYSSATAESVLSHSPHLLRQHPHLHQHHNPPMPQQQLQKGPSMATIATHVYAGIDSDYGSVTNEDSMVSVHKPLVAKGSSSSSGGHSQPQEPQSPVTSTTSADTEVTSMLEAENADDEASVVLKESPANGFFV